MRDGLVSDRRAIVKLRAVLHVMQVRPATCVPNHMCMIESAIRAPTGLLDACKLQ